MNDDVDQNVSKAPIFLKRVPLMEHIENNDTVKLLLNHNANVDVHES